MKKLTLLLLLIPVFANAQTVAPNQNRTLPTVQKTTKPVQNVQTSKPVQAPAPKIYAAPPRDTLQKHSMQTHQKDLVYCKNEFNKQRSFRVSPIVKQNEYLQECIQNRAQYDVKKQSLDEKCKKEQNPQACLKKWQGSLGSASQNASATTIKNEQIATQNSIQKHVAFCTKYLNDNTKNKQIMATSRSQWLHDCISTQTQLEVKNATSTKR